MSERDMTKSDSLNSEDKQLNEDYYFDEIDETDEDYYLDDLDEEDEDYFFDEEDEPAEEPKKKSKPVQNAKKSVKAKPSEEKKAKVTPNVIPVNSAKKMDTEEDGFKEDDFEDVVSDEIKPKRRKRRKSKTGKGKDSKSMKKLWIILGCIAAILIAAYVGVSVFFNSHFFINTEINGHDFSGKTVADVENYLKEQVKGYKLTVLEKDNKSDTIDGDTITLTYKENDDIKKALKKQNGFTWPASLFSKNSSKVTIEVAYDENALNNEIQNLQAVTAEQIPAKSAYPKFDGEKFSVEPEVIGTAVNMDMLNTKIHQFISEFRTELDMEKEECYASPKYTSESEEVKKACDAMNNYTKASITYTMTEQEIIDKALISTWLSVDDNMQVTFDENKVREWLTAFGDKYDTVGTTRTITTPTGKSVEVSGGTYGWSIDEDTEFEALTNSIKNGETVTKEPAYYQTAAAHAPQDWGNTYAEVDLSTQHMWYIVDGNVAMESDIVTGLPTPEKETPSGVYDILELQRNKTLVGEIDPETGEPEYETPVNFWMRITWTGIGFHDATWQPGFGGSLYTSIGSHGCVNMPYDQAENLYGMLSIGTPVIMHY